MLRIYGDHRSGNCYKVKLMMHLLGRPYEWVPIDLTSGETRSEAFRAINPNGKIPVLELEDGTHLWESNAILNYLAEGSEFLPRDPRLRTQVLQWQFFEQYSHEPYLSGARMIKVFEGDPPERREEYEAKRYDGYHALNVMEQQLQRTPYLVGDTCSIADVALYPFTSLAEESGFDLADYPAIRAWLQRVASHPRYIPITAE
ncbi:MAG TPA: glutathione S-transferase family protein [Pseudomonas sp.]|jgi:glutathione S-transferase|nr:glutathione S-transferase family protein [Pseudomonas sp.]